MPGWAAADSALNSNKATSKDFMGQVIYSESYANFRVLGYLWEESEYSHWLPNELNRKALL